MHGSDASTIKFNLFDTEDNRGEAITTFELWMNNGTGTTAFTKIVQWASAPLTFEVNTTINGLVSEQIYTFFTRTRNNFEYLNSSAEVRFVAAKTSLTMSKPVKVQSGSNTTQITVKWDAANDTEVEITSYKLRVAEGNEEYQLAYDANLNIFPRKFTYTGPTWGNFIDLKLLQLI